MFPTIPQILNIYIIYLPWCLEWVVQPGWRFRLLYLRHYVEPTHMTRSYIGNNNKLGRPSSCLYNTLCLYICVCENCLFSFLTLWKRMFTETEIALVVLFIIWRLNQVSTVDTLACLATIIVNKTLGVLFSPLANASIYARYPFSF